MGKNIGLISTRFAGSDGVSLESNKWGDVLKEEGHANFWYAGRLDRDPEISLCIPEAYFGDPENLWINSYVWGRHTRSRRITGRIMDFASYLKDTLYQFVDKFDLDILIPQNILAIPMHIPLGIAMTEFLAETEMPAIAHHHDFYWERKRFLVNAVSDLLEMAFPPITDDSVQHVVINKAAQEELAWRKGMSSIVMHNVFDFENPAPGIDDYSRDLREEIGIGKDDFMVLQPTRVVARKGIEHAIHMIRMLGDPRYKLVVSHDSGDEGEAYKDMLISLAKESNVDLVFISSRVGEKRHFDVHGRKIYTLWDVYPHADLVSYPSRYEGFGNGLLEAIYFKIPVLVNRYPIFARDIEPHKFRLITMDEFITRKEVDQVKHVLEDSDYRKEMVEHNHQIALKYFSYATLRRWLHPMISENPYL